MQHLTNETHVQYRNIFAHLFPPKKEGEKNETGSAKSENRQGSASSLSSIEDETKPEDRYFTLAMDDKLLLLLGLIDRVKMTKHIRSFVDKAEPHLTELRKEKTDLNREKRKLTEQLEGGGDKGNAQTPAGAAAAPANGSAPTQPLAPSVSEQASEPVADNQSEALSEPPPADEEEADDDDEEEDDEEVDQLASDSDEEMAQEEEEPVDSKTKAKEAMPEPKPVKLTPEEEAARMSERVEEVDNEFRSTSGTLRLRPLGEDRFFNTYWFFDGLGSRPLQGTAANPGGEYETGRLFVHRPHLPDPAVMSASYELISRLMEDTESDLPKDERLYAQVERDISDLLADRRKEEEGEEGVLAPGEWGAYDSVDDIKSLMNWLQQKGNRELALRNSLQRWLPWMERSINSRKDSLKSAVQDGQMDIDAAPSSTSYRSWTNKRIS